MTARVDRQEVVMGSLIFLEEKGVAMDAALVNSAEAFRATGASVVLWALRGLLPVMMLTGDNARAAHVVAAAVGISHVEAGLMPDDKRAFIQKMQEAGSGRGVRRRRYQ